jgi:hypothetical protein
MLVPIPMWLQKWGIPSILGDIDNLFLFFGGAGSFLLHITRLLLLGQVVVSGNFLHMSRFPCMVVAELREIRHESSMMLVISGDK